MMKSYAVYLILLYTALYQPVYAQQVDRNIHIETTINAPVPRVWQAWTTKQGLESFFAPKANIDLRVDGTLDILFNPDAPKGQRGAEGMRLLSIEPNKMLSFTWNNPPDMARIHNQRTHVTIKLSPTGNRRTKLVLIHDGWGDGPLWDEAYRYFIRSWRDVILFRLHYRFDNGPINWDRPPKNLKRYNIIVH